MNYLVTGGTGLIGKAVVAKLVQTNAQVTVLTRDLAKAKATLPSDVLLVDEVSITEIEQSDVVINLAGEAIADKRWSVDQKTKICDSRWTITDKLASLINAAKTPPKLFISGSAIGIYGRQNENAITEGFTEFHPEFTHDICYEWENIAMQASSKKTRVALLRTGIVLDKHKGALSKKEANQVWFSKNFGR